MTGLIYVILIGVWGVVLVPRWLRRHDETREMRDSEALEAALSGERNDGEHDSDELGIDEYGQSDAQDSRAATWGEYLAGLVQVDLGRYADQLKMRGSGPATTARRRRNILLALAAAVVVSLIGAVVGVLPGALVVLSTFLLGGYVSAMVLFMRNGAARSGGRLDHQRDTESRSAGRDQGDSGVAVDGVRVVGAEADRWDPRETTLPTYVTKTKASKIPRRIDLTTGWTGADMVAQAREQQASPELEQQFDREWAVVAPQPDDEVADYANGHVEDEGYYRRAVNE